MTVDAFDSFGPGHETNLDSSPPGRKGAKTPPQAFEGPNSALLRVCDLVRGTYLVSLTTNLSGASVTLASGL
jgi:hypothetical protein